MSETLKNNDDANQGTGVENAESVGRKLKEARESAGIHINEMAGRLRLTATQLEALESGRLGQFGAAIYVRGYVANYARQVGLRPDRLLTELNLADEEPPLKAAAGVPPHRRLVDGLVRWGSYAAGTVVLVLPIIWWINEGSTHLFDDRDGGSMPAANVTDAATTETMGSAETEPAAGSPGKALEQPVMASMTPVRTDRAVAETPADSPVAQDGNAEEGEADPASVGAVLVLHVKEDSWVEMHDASGERLEYDLLRAGTTHRYEGTPPYRLLIGNAGGVEVLYNDSPFDMTSHVQGNLARFEVGEPEEAPAGG